MPQRRLRSVSSVTESRGIQYSAEAAGDHGSIRCHVIRRRLVRERRVQYSIVVRNGTGDEAQALAFVPAHDGSRRTIVQTAIGPESDFSMTVALELVPPGIMPELRVAVTSGVTQFTLEVPALAADAAGDVPDEIELAFPPVAVGTALQPRNGHLPDLYRPPVAATATGPPPRPVGRAPLRARPSPPVLPMLILFALVLAGVAYVIGRPQVAELTVPPLATAGADVTIGYRATGLGTPAYELLGPDGTALTRGRLERGAGDFSVKLPAASNVPAYLIRLKMDGPAGSAASEAYVHVAPPPAPVAAHAPVRRRTAPHAPPAPPQIRSLALDRSTVASGEALTVYYDVDAAGGSVALFDPASQITYGKFDLASSGQSTFTAPHVEQSRILAVVATAQRGRLTTQSRIAVTVTPLDAAGADAGSAGTDPNIPADASGSPVPSSTTIAAPAVVRGGKLVRVDVSGAQTGLQIVLLDGIGRELEHHDLSAGHGSAEFTAPQVRVPTRFLFEATYPHGVGSETQVRAITVMP